MVFWGRASLVLGRGLYYNLEVKSEDLYRITPANLLGTSILHTPSTYVAWVPLSTTTGKHSRELSEKAPLSGSMS